MRLYYLIFLLEYLQISKGTNLELLEIEPYLLSNVMKEFMVRIIMENSHEKDGFLYIAINEVEPDFSDFAIKKLNELASVIIINFGINQNIKPLLNPNHFKFVLTDPEGDLSYANDIFKRVRVSRAKIVLILTKQPVPIFITYLLNSYAKIKCFNVIVVYESDGKIEVMTHNPFLPTFNKIVDLTNSPLPFFYDKTRDLHGSRINCLFTFHDRTKIKKVRRNGKVHFEGKDYNAIATIVAHLNGKLQVETMDNAFINPWFEAINWPDRANRKIRILEKRDISILIKSEQFTVDDQIVENLYPHTQNDLSILVPKASEIPVGELMASIYKPSTWALNMTISLSNEIVGVVRKFNNNVPVVFLLIVTIRKLCKKHIIIKDVFFEVLSVLVINHVIHFPRNCLERLLIFGWILSGFIINMFLQTKITSFLAIRLNHPDINTIEQVFESGLPLYSLPNYAEEVQKKYNGTQYEKFILALLPLDSNEGLMDQMTYKNDISKIPAFIIEHDIALFVSRCKNLRRNGAQMYHLVKESIIPNYQSYKVIHNSPLLPVLNKKLRRLGEGGFIELWAKRSIHNATLEGFLSPEGVADTDAIKPLTLDMTLFLFYGLLLGLLFATLAFLVELFVYEITKPKQFVFLH